MAEVYLAFISFYSSNHDDVAYNFLTIKNRTTHQKLAIIKSTKKPGLKQHQKKGNLLNSEKVLIKTESGFSYSITLNKYCTLNTYLLPYVGSFCIRRVPNGPCLRFHQELFNNNKIIKKSNKMAKNTNDGDEEKGKKGNCYGSVKYKYSTLLNYLKEDESCQDKVLLYSFLCKKIDEEYERRDFYDIDEFIHSPECSNHSEESMREYLNENYYYGPIELLKKLEESACSWISYACRGMINLMKEADCCKDLLTYLSSFPRNPVLISDKKIGVSAKCIRDLLSELMYFSIDDTMFIDVCSGDFCGRMKHFFHKSDTTYPMDMFLIDPFDLISAVEDQSIEKFKLFISKPWTDINQLRQDGETALSMTCKRNDPKMMKKLLKLPNIDVNKTGNTLYHACKSSELFNQLLESGHYINVNKISTHQMGDIFETILTSTPLETACCYENYDVVLKLLAHNADIRIKELSFNLTTPEIQQLLLNHGYCNNNN